MDQKDNVFFENIEIDSEDRERKKRVRKLQTEWDVKTTIALIKNVEKYEHLWNSHDKFHKNRDMTNSSWVTISETLGLPKDEVILKWNGIRGNYRAHLQKGNRIRNPNSRISRPSNSIFAYMSFLKPVLRSDTKQHLSIINKTQDETQSAPSSEGNSESQPLSFDSMTDMNDHDDDPLAYMSAKRLKVEEDNQKQQNQQNHSLQRNTIMKNDFGMLVKTNKNDDDEWEALGKMIATNGRTWASENLPLARRYKAALSAVNSQYEMEMAEYTNQMQYIKLDISTENK